MAKDLVVFDQADLPDKAKDVVHQGAACHDQLIRGKLPGWKPFKVHICLDLGMVLFTQPMSLVEFDDLFVRKPQARPPPFQFDLRDQEPLSFLVDGPLVPPQTEMDFKAV